MNAPPTETFPSDTGCAIVSLTGVALLGVLVGLGMLDSPPVANVGFMIVLISLTALALILVGSVINEHTRTHEARPRPVDREAFKAPTIVIRTKLRCPFCHDALAGETLECGGCKARYHPECLEEAHGCATLGCQHMAPRRRLRA